MQIYSIFGRRRKQKRPLGKGGKIIFCIIGIASLSFGTTLLKTNYNTVTNGYKVPGKIVEVVKKGNGSDASYYPVVEFKEKTSNKIIKHKMNIGSSSYRNSINQDVELIVSEKNNKLSILFNSFTGIWLFPIVALLMGSIFTLIPFLPQKKEQTILPENNGENLQRINALYEQIESAYRSKGWSNEDSIRNTNKMKNMYNILPDEKKIQILEETLKRIPSKK